MNRKHELFIPYAGTPYMGKAFRWESARLMVGQAERQGQDWWTYWLWHLATEQEEDLYWSEVAEAWQEVQRDPQYQQQSERQWEVV